VDFEESLVKHGFHPAAGRTPRGVQVLVAEPNPFLTYTVQAFDDGTALFSWEFAVGEYLGTKGIQFGSDETLNQFAFPREDERGPQEGVWLVEVIERARALLASVRFDRPLQP
jgi:NAD/NADP transhydrogenase beta subunit